MMQVLCLLVYDGRVGEPEVDNPPGRHPGAANPPGSGQPPTKYTKKREVNGIWLKIFHGTRGA